MPICCEMIGFAAQRLMELEVEGLTGAAYGEKAPERLAQRNGYRDRTWETRAGTVELRIPKLRKRFAPIASRTPQRYSTFRKPNWKASASPRRRVSAATIAPHGVRHGRAATAAIQRSTRIMILAPLSTIPTHSIRIGATDMTATIR
jgi:transposase-like protein